MIEIVLTIIFGIFIGMLFAHFYFRAKVELAARRFSDKIEERVFERKKAELGSLFEERHRAVLKGRKAEQQAPFFDAFGFNPSDARILGDPVDYVIFDGYTRVRERLGDGPIAVVLADVKTGQAGLTYEQRRIKRGIEKGLVRFETIRM